MARRTFDVEGGGSLDFMSSCMLKYLTVLLCLMSWQLDSDTNNIITHHIVHIITPIYYFTLKGQEQRAAFRRQTII